MTLHPRLTRATVFLVKRFETFQSEAQPTPEGGWSIGYGHSRSARAGAKVTLADAEALLIYDLDAAARVVGQALFAPVSQRQFEALTALCFNLGEAAFLRSSALARTNAGAELDAADEIERWRRAELGAGMQVVDALVRRRAAEKAHFLGLPDGEATWPSALLRPLAAPGGDNLETSSAVECPGSAALSAVNGVQARLRRLIPDTDGPVTPGVTGTGIEAEGQTPAEPEGGGEPPPPHADPLATSGTPESPLHPDPQVRWEADPPPFDLATGPDEPRPDPAPEPQPPASRPVAASPPSSAAAAVAARRPRPAYALLGAVGVMLFVAAIAMILLGQPGLLDLGLGIAGVLAAAPALYGLLDRGPRRIEDEPFHKGGADTK